MHLAWLYPSSVGIIATSIWLFSEDFLKDGDKTDDTFRIENCISETKEKLCSFYYIW
jgi:hypothetical protein